MNTSDCDHFTLNRVCSLDLTAEFQCIFCNKQLGASGRTKMRCILIDLQAKDKQV